MREKGICGLWGRRGDITESGCVAAEIKSAFLYIFFSRARLLLLYPIQYMFFVLTIYFPTFFGLLPSSNTESAPHFFV